MDFSLSEEQHLLVSSIRGFIESELRPLEEDIEKTGRLADDVALRSALNPGNSVFMQLIFQLNTAVVVCRSWTG